MPTDAWASTANVAFLPMKLARPTLTLAKESVLTKGYVVRATVLRIPRVSENFARVVRVSFRLSQIVSSSPYTFILYGIAYSPEVKV